MDATSLADRLAVMRDAVEGSLRFLIASMGVGHLP